MIIKIRLKLFYKNDIETSSFMVRSHDSVILHSEDCVILHRYNSKEDFYNGVISDISEFVFRGWYNISTRNDYTSEYYFDTSFNGVKDAIYLKIDGEVKNLIRDESLNFILD